MFLVGLTGGIATGKSTVAGMLKELGVEVIDADLVARKVVEPGTPAWKKIKETFGEDVLLPTGELNRPLMAQIIFSDPDKRKLLNAITHPEIYKSIFWNCLRMLVKGHQFVVLDLPLLFESGAMIPYMNTIIVVACDEQQQLERLMERNGYDFEEAQQRVQAQMSLREKCHRADYVIDNSKDEEYTKEQVKRVVQYLKRSNSHWKMRALLWGGLTSMGFLLVWSTMRIIFWVSTWKK